MSILAADSAVKSRRGLMQTYLEHASMITSMYLSLLRDVGTYIASILRFLKSPNFDVVYLSLIHI